MTEEEREKYKEEREEDSFMEVAIGPNFGYLLM